MFTTQPQTCQNRIKNSTWRGTSATPYFPGIRSRRKGLHNHSTDCLKLLSHEPQAIQRGRLEGPAEAHRIMKAEISSLQDFKRKPLRASKLSTQPKAAVEKLPTCSYCYRILARQPADLQLEEVFVGLPSAAY